MNGSRLRLWIGVVVVVPVSSLMQLRRLRKLNPSIFIWKWFRSQQWHSVTVETCRRFQNSVVSSVWSLAVASIWRYRWSYPMIRNNDSFCSFGALIFSPRVVLLLEWYSSSSAMKQTSRPNPEPMSHISINFDWCSMDRIFSFNNGSSIYSIIGSGDHNRGSGNGVGSRGEDIGWRSLSLGTISLCWGTNGQG